MLYLSTCKILKCKIPCCAPINKQSVKEVISIDDSVCDIRDSKVDSKVVPVRFKRFTGVLVREIIRHTLDKCIILLVFSIEHIKSFQSKSLLIFQVGSPLNLFALMCTVTGSKPLLSAIQTSHPLKTDVKNQHPQNS